MTTIQYIRFVLLAWLLGSGLAHAQDSAVFDAQQNAWKLYYKDPETEQWVNKTYVARTAIQPSIKTSVTGNGMPFTYHYTLRNQRGAQQNISVIRIWGIPLVYAIPDLPPVTANIRTDNDKWTQQNWVQLTAKRNFESSVVKAPKGWSAGLRVDEKEGQTSFVWTPGLKDTDPNGVEPGRSQSGFAVMRPELPGVARTYLKGSIEEPWALDSLPETPFWTAKVDEIQELDYVLVPVLAPVISVPSPYNGAELARRMRAHTQTWLKYGHVSADVLGRLNRQFDALIPALEGNNKVAARAAAIEMFKEVFGHHRGLTHQKLDEDDEDQAAEALPRKQAGHTGVAVNTAPQPVTVDRVAARALAFNLVYLLARLEKER
jgi:hypothetical protein